MEAKREGHVVDTLQDGLRIRRPGCQAWLAPRLLCPQTKPSLSEQQAPPLQHQRALQFQKTSSKVRAYLTRGVRCRRLVRSHSPESSVREESEKVNDINSWHVLSVTEIFSGIQHDLQGQRQRETKLQIQGLPLVHRSFPEEEPGDLTVASSEVPGDCKCWV